MAALRVGCVPSPNFRTVRVRRARCIVASWRSEHRCHTAGTSSCSDCPIWYPSRDSVCWYGVCAWRIHSVGSLSINRLRRYVSALCRSWISRIPAQVCQRCARQHDVHLGHAVSICTRVWFESTPSALLWCVVVYVLRCTRAYLCLCATSTVVRSAPCHALSRMKALLCWWLKKTAVSQHGGQCVVA